MNKLREKFNIPKAHSLCGSHLGGSLETMIRDSFYLAWPMASGSDSLETKRGYLTKSAAFDEGDSSDR